VYKNKEKETYYREKVF